MKPLEKHRDVTSSGVTQSAEFDISYEDRAHLMTILRDTLYSDKVLAVLREYSANAWDAHRMVGKGDVPIEVTLPTWTEPTLIIKDHGPGMNRQEVFERYTKFGASSKRDADIAVGMLGIGSKSGFAYTDSFTIVSCCEGIRSTYVALLDESEKGTINLLSEEPCGDETGVAIHIAVRQQDINEFEEKAKQLFQYFEPRPKINADLPPVPALKAKLKHGVIFDKEINEHTADGWVAVMGCIPYEVDFDQLKNPNGSDAVSRSLRRTAGALYFDIGEIQINASREALKYSDITKKALIKKFEDVLDEFVQLTLQEIDAENLSPWEKRLKAQILVTLGLGGNVGNKEFATDRIIMKGVNPDTFTLNTHSTYGGLSSVTAISIKSKSRLIKRKEHGRKRSLEGYHLDYHDYLVTPRPGKSWEEVDAELEKFCADYSLTGIPIVELQTLPWTPKTVQYARTPNEKHKVSSFRLTHAWRRDKLSDCWEIVQREPEPTDVFVVLRHFESKESGVDIYSKRREDLKLAEFFGLELPEIYGYKSTEKAPVSVTSTTGIHYPDWRRKFIEGLDKTKAQALYENYQWTQAFPYSRIELNGKVRATLAKRLGEDHLIVSYVDKYLENQKLAATYSGASELVDIFTTWKLVTSAHATEAFRMKADVMLTYPLLAICGGLPEIWGGNSQKWLDYIDLIDSKN